MDKRTINQVLHTGGWFWFRGKIFSLKIQVGYVEEVIFVPYPNHQPQPDYWVIPFYGEWLAPNDFTGEWWGPMIPPWEQEKEKST